MAERFARNWLVVFVVSNIVLLVASFLFLPATRRLDGATGHIEAVILCCALTAAVVGISIAGLLTNWRLGTVLAAIEVAQVLRLLTAMAAVSAWPRGDDGPLIGWQGIVLPIMLLLVILGGCSWYLYMKKIDEIEEVSCQ